MSISDKISAISLIIAAAAVTFSIISYRDNKSLAIEGFNRSYRPYVFAANFTYINPKDQLWYPNMNVLLINLVNAPAFITTEQVAFYIRNDHSDSLLFQHPEYKDILAYPSDKQQMTINTDLKTISHELAIKLYPKKLIRKVYIEYTWISKSDDKYFFKSESQYNIDKHNWDAISQTAN